MKTSRKLLAAGTLMVLAACTQEVIAPPAPTPPVARPSVEVPEVPEVAEPSEASKALAVHYRDLQRKLLIQGLLRGDGGGPDTPFTDTDLARNFVRIALFNEYVAEGDELRAQANVANLRRFDQPVRIGLEFGGTTPPDRRARDESSVAAYAARLSRITGHPITLAEDNPNFHVFIVNEDERRALGARLEELVPGMLPSSRNALINLPKDQLCIVIAFAEGESASYSKAISIIRAEHPDLLRTTCIHEELAQGLGLANDSPRARPSIFNDDEEFGLLTTHDEWLLKMLYDPRLQTGMKPAEAAPIARIIAREYLDPGAG